MKLLLDTHTFIWWDSDPAKLSATALALCSDPINDLILSVTSLWEMHIKHQLGKLSLRLPLVDTVAHQQTTNGVIVLPILPTHVFALDGLPTAHKDPFDRLLVAQANSEGATLVSTDAIFTSYPVRLTWSCHNPTCRPTRRSNRPLRARSWRFWRDPVQRTHGN